ALNQCPQMGVRHAEKQFAKPRRQLGDVLGALWQKVLGLDAAGVNHLEVRENQLQGTLKDLGFPADVEVVARLEGSGQSLARIPEPGANASRFVAELEVEVKIALAVGPKLFVGDQERLVDRVSVGKLIDEATRHAAVRPWLRIS